MAKPSPRYRPPDRWLGAEDVAGEVAALEAEGVEASGRGRGDALAGRRIATRRRLHVGRDTRDLRCDPRWPAVPGGTAAHWRVPRAGAARGAFRRGFMQLAMLTGTASSSASCGRGRRIGPTRWSDLPAREDRRCRPFCVPALPLLWVMPADRICFASYSNASASNMIGGRSDVGSAQGSSSPRAPSRSCRSPGGWLRPPFLRAEARAVPAPCLTGLERFQANRDLVAVCRCENATNQQLKGHVPIPNNRKRL